MSLCRVVYSMEQRKDCLKPRAVVTCGPGVAPIDAVRCITNASTGELGVLLSEKLVEAGWNVVCLKSAAASFRDPIGSSCRVVRFTTNMDLLQTLQTEQGREHVCAVFHVAALCDYEVKSVETPLAGRLHGKQKIASEHEELRITLSRAPKILPHLRSVFPNARIVGWKLEWDGDRSHALEKGQAQLKQHGSALCVVNGPAYGEGFGVLNPEGILVHLNSKTAVCAWLVEWAQSSVS